MTQQGNQPLDDRSAAARTLGGRYRVLEELGRGGTAVVYRVRDEGTGQALALKQLSPREGSKGAQANSLFEREFHALSQLAHPGVVEVYDYGVDDAGPYYTMELLDGGDLKQLAPLPPERACKLMLEVCSSLALMHSRRLVHRDISPRNIRCTRDGHAKLIDFGAMAPMGPCSHTVGTPAFVAPEVVHHLTLDARTDLFSLGATLYYALTGRAPFIARNFLDLRIAWAQELLPPSQLTPGIPPALDALCAALLRIDPAQRPRSTFEVMQRLATIAGVEHEEPEAVSFAYLRTPVLVGRTMITRALRQRMRRALHGAGGAALLRANPGLGRSRILDACMLEAKTLGATVLRAGSEGATNQPFTAAVTLAEALLAALPDAASAAAERVRVQATLFEAGDPTTTQRRLRAARELAADPANVHAALCAWLLAICDTHALLIAADDLERIDEASLSLLAMLALEAPERRMLVVATADATAEADAPRALSVLVQHCTAFELAALRRSETYALLSSVFDEIPHLAPRSASRRSRAVSVMASSSAITRSCARSRWPKPAPGGWTRPPRASMR